MDPWIAEFERLRAHHPEFPSRALELRTSSAMGILAHRQPQHPFLRTWAERTLALLKAAEDRHLCIVLGGYLVMCFLWWGESVRARAVIDTVTPWTHTPDIAPMVYLLWSCAVALYHSVHGNQEACLESVEDGLALARKTGLHSWDFHLCAQAARCGLVTGDLASAETWMSAMAETMRSHSHVNGGYYLHLRTHAAGQRGDWHGATEHARTALKMAIEAGVPFLEGHCRIDLARALLGLGDEAEWMEHLAAARAIGQAMGSRVLEYLCLETEAKAAFQQSRDSLGLERLSEALALSRAMDGAYWLLGGPEASRPAL